MKKSLFLLVIPMILLILIHSTGMLSKRYEKTQNETKVPGSFRSLSYMSAVRAYPYPDIPADGYSRAFDSYRSRMRGPHDFGTEWQPLGPHNIGGRTLDIALNPQNPATIWAASASGGLWRSYSGGIGFGVWERIPLGFPALAIGAVEISPADTNILFVGTGECYGYGTYYPSVSFRATRGLNGMGILKSADNGQTWIKSLDWSYNQNQGVQCIRFDPQNPDIVWAATTDGTYRSTDLGETWYQVHDVPMATDIIIIPENPDIVIVACGGMYSEGHGIYRSTDGGSNWIKLTLGAGGPQTFGGKVRLCMAPSAHNIIYASIGRSQSTGASGTWLCKSTDYGENWMVANTTNYSDYQGWYSHYVGVVLNNPNKLFCGGIDMYQSSNGGTSLIYNNGQVNDWFHPDWLHSDHHDYEPHPTNPNTIYFATDGGVFRTDDGGINFYSCNWGYQTGQFYPGFSCSDSDSLLAMGGLQDNFSAIYRGDFNWSRVIGGDGCHTAINQDNNNILYGSYQYLSIRKSTNGGNSFTAIQPSYQGNVNFVAPFVLSPVTNTTLYAASSVIYRSNNSGSTWTATNPVSLFDNNPVIALGISSTVATVVFAATMPINSSHQIVRTTNGGIEWEDLTTPDLPDRMPTDIHVDASDHDIVYVTYGGFGTPHLYRSTDGGDTWTDLGQDLPDIPGWAVVTDPLYPEHIYYGNEFGVYVSIDGGLSWQEFNEGLGDGVFAMDLKISMSNRKLRVATHGNGIFERELVEPAVATKDISLNRISTFNLRNYPNPFTDYTYITFELLEMSHVNLEIFDLSGQKIASLIDQKMMQGNHSIRWDRGVVNGTWLQSGVYIIELCIDNLITSYKIMLF